MRLARPRSTAHNALSRPTIDRSAAAGPQKARGQEAAKTDESRRGRPRRVTSLGRGFGQHLGREGRRSLDKLLALAANGTGVMTTGRLRNFLHHPERLALAARFCLTGRDAPQVADAGTKRSRYPVRNFIAAATNNRVKERIQRPNVVANQAASDRALHPFERGVQRGKVSIRRL